MGVECAGVIHRGKRDFVFAGIITPSDKRKNPEFLCISCAKQENKWDGVKEKSKMPSFKEIQESIQLLTEESQRVYYVDETHDLESTQTT